jgi:16S rRNA (adenine1518-N6/adenine1519-N6)-dimethyltransferase
MDALEFDYTQASQQTALQGRDLRITGNIPYQITSPLIMRILESGAEFTRMVLMMQREVAQRLNAKPNTRRNGGITIKVQYFCRVQEVMEVPARSFIPPPKVDSTVLAFERKPESISHADRKCFFELIDGAFGQRRKMLPNSISAADIGYSREQVQSALESLGLRKDARAENLGLDEFLGLFHILNR